MILKRICALLSILPMLLFTSVQGVLALELEISGNGNSTNEVNVSQNTTTTVEQSNAATVENNVETQANTGNNNANDNTGENTNIDTGSITLNNSVANSLNTSVAQAGCCDTDHQNTAKIIGNGADSTNTIGVNSSNTVKATISQIANINNTIKGSANTGYNNANGNNGDVSISTGWIKKTDSISNIDINKADVLVFVGDPAWNITISGNGSGSTNNILLNLTNDVITDVYNVADLNNVSLWKLNTGHNDANDNNGTVTIATGNIYASTAIKNEGINVSKTTVDCCEEKITPENPPVIPPPTGGGCVSNCGSVNNPPTGGGQGGPSSSVGSVLGGSILPATGMSFWLFATIANILMFLLGLYLRLRAGRSPAKAYATR